MDKFRHEIKYIDPVFARYGDGLGKYLTQWLYGDSKANPLWDQPDAWASNGIVKIVNRSLDFDSIASGATSTQNFDIMGGKNAIIFSRAATGIPATPVLGVPLQQPYLAYTTYRQAQVDGFIEVETTATDAVFGTGTWPHILATPDLWLGNTQRRITFTNNTGAVLSAKFTGECAMLHTGR